MNTKTKAAFKWIAPTALVVGLAFQPVSAGDKYYKKHNYGSSQHHYNNHYPYYGNGPNYRLRQKRLHHRPYQQKRYYDQPYQQGYHNRDRNSYKPRYYGRHGYRDGRRFRRHLQYRHRSGYHGYNGGYIYINF